MSKKGMFILAHKITKDIVQKGDSYQATFGLVLKKVYKLVKRLNNVMRTLATILANKNICSEGLEETIFRNLSLQVQKPRRYLDILSRGLYDSEQVLKLY